MAVHGNSECLAFIEEVKREIERGNVNWIGTVMVIPGDVAGYGYAGAPGSINCARTGLKTLDSVIQARHEERKTGLRNENASASYHEYNLAADPINFDFLIWLIDAEMMRRRLGAPWPLRVGFSHENELNDKGKRFWAAVHKPLLSLIGAVEDPEAIGGHRSALFTPSEICRAAKRGEKVPILEANKDARAHVRGWLRGQSSEGRPRSQLRCGNRPIGDRNRGPTAIAILSRGSSSRRICGPRENSSFL
jgi:hypothetical protein